MTKERLEALGLQVKIGKSVFKKCFYFAGTDQERAQDINDMFADPKVKAIFEVRGGTNCSRILPYLNYKLIKNNPKIFIGFSDITSLLLAIHAKTGLVTFHGTMGVFKWPQFTVDYMKRVLFDGEAVQFVNPKTPLNLEEDIIQTNRIRTINPGVAKGKLIGGNLAVLTTLLGSNNLPQWEGAILFLEDCDEPYYAIDRMFTQLQAAGILKQLSGIVLGQFTDCSASKGSMLDVIGSPTLNQILDHYIKPLKIPAYYGAMIGHTPKMFTLPEGLPVQIDADQGTITMLEPAVK
jgi:muramoyltetrapeptide carboxypeptidase